MVLSAKERVLQMEFFEAQEGVYTGEIPAEFGLERPEEEAAASAVRPAPPTSTEEPREKKPRKGGQSHIHPSRRGRGEKQGGPSRGRTPMVLLFALRPRWRGWEVLRPPLGPGISAQAVFEVESPPPLETPPTYSWTPQLGESTAVTSLREVDVRHFVAPLQPQRNGQQIGKNELSVVLEPLHVVRDFALPVHGESAHAVQGERVHSSACELCGHLFAAPAQDPNIKNNQEPDTRHRDPAAGLGLAADQGELILSSDPETRRELHKRLSHVSQGHVPYWANCEACNRSRGLTPARMRGDRPEKEYQVDQFMYRSRCFIILVHVLAFAVAVTFRPEGMSGRETSTYLEPWLAHFGLSRSGDTKPPFYSDPEPLTISIAQALAERYEGHSESFAPERHAPVAERAVRLSEDPKRDCVFS